MKLKAFALALFLAGVGTSIAVAKGPPPGKGKDKASSSSSTSSTSTTTTGSTTTTTGKKLKICHRTGSVRNPFRLISVSRSALESHMRHGDLMAPTTGGCPRQGGGTTSTTASP